MPLPLTISCSSKSRLVLPFWYLLTRVVPDRFQHSSKTVVCCVCVVHRSIEQRAYDRTFACAICLSADVSSGDTSEWMWMPFGVVSGVGLIRGVLDFGGDRWKGRGSLSVNTMQKWRIDWLLTRVWKVDNISLWRMYRWIRWRRGFLMI